MLNPANFITRTPMEDLAFQFINQQTDLIGTEILPSKVVGGNQTSVKIYQYDNSMLKQVQTKSSSKGAVGKVDYDVFTRNVDLDLYKLGADIDPKDEATFDRPVNRVRINQARNIWQRLMLDNEILAAALCTDSTKYPTALTKLLVDGTNTWLDAGGDPEADAVVAENAIRTSCGRAKNAATMSKTTFNLLRTSPTFRERVKYTSGFMDVNAFTAALKAMLGVDYLFIGAAKKNTGVDGAADVIADIWNDSVIFHYHNPSPELEDISYGHTYIRKQLYTYEALDPKRGGPDGRITELEMGWEWVQASGFVESSISTKFAAGYLLRNAV